MTKLQEEYKKKRLKKGGNPSEVKRLMKITKAKRCQWIRDECPLISMIIEKFPHLSASYWVCQTVWDTYNYIQYNNFFRYEENSKELRL